MGISLAGSIASGMRLGCPRQAILVGCAILEAYCCTQWQHSIATSMLGIVGSDGRDPNLSDDETVAKMGHLDFRCGPPVRRWGTQQPAECANARCKRVSNEHT